MVANRSLFEPQNVAVADNQIRVRVGGVSLMLDLSGTVPAIEAAVERIVENAVRNAVANVTRAATRTIAPADGGPRGSKTEPEPARVDGQNVTAKRQTRKPPEQLIKAAAALCLAAYPAGVRPDRELLVAAAQIVDADARRFLTGVVPRSVATAGAALLLVARETPADVGRWWYYACGAAAQAGDMTQSEFVGAWKWRGERVRVAARYRNDNPERSRYTLSDVDRIAAVRHLCSSYLEDARKKGPINVK